jgi:hypothetical protein
VATGEAHPTALVCGYAITVVGFLLFWGPLSVVRSAGVALDGSKGWGQRAMSGACGCALGMGVAYVVVGFVLLVVPLSTDILCRGYVPGMRPGCEGLVVRCQYVRLHSSSSSSSSSSSRRRSSGRSRS